MGDRRRLGTGFASLSTAASRAVELYSPEDRRLLDDRLAFTLLPLTWRILFRLILPPGLRGMVLALRERRFPGVLGSLLCRTRYIDDVVRTSIEAGTEQLVILGAGFDTRAYRIPGVERLRVFEVDLPGTVQLKQARVKAVLGAVPAHVTFVGMDFDTQSLRDELETAGFRPGKKTLFTWEGVTQYITADAVNDTLRVISGASGDGSAAVFTYIRKGIIDGSTSSESDRRLASFARSAGSPWIFGFDPTELPQYLADRGLMLTDDIGAADFQERYLRPLGRTMKLFEGERVALAYRNPGIPGTPHSIHSCE